MAREELEVIARTALEEDGRAHVRACYVRASLVAIAFAACGCVGSNPPGSDLPIDPGVYPDLGRTTIDRVPRGVIGLTFDDGPSSDFTRDVVDVLDKHHTHAIFFDIGQNIAGNRDVLEYVRSHGNQIGNHTYYHEAQPSLSKEVFQFRVRAVKRNIGAADEGHYYFRFPYGAAGRDQLAWLAEIDPDENGGHYRVVGWNFDSQDWDYATHAGVSTAILDDSPKCGPDANPWQRDYVGWTQFIARLTGGGVVLFHDIQPNTHDHIDEILTDYENPAAYWASLPADTRTTYLRYYACAKVDPNLRFRFEAPWEGSWPSLKR